MFYLNIQKANPASNVKFSDIFMDDYAVLSP